MSITPEKYIRKPLIVLGVEVTKSNFVELALWLQGSIQNKDGSEPDVIDPDKQYILVRVHNPKSPRQSQAFVGDWILYSDRGYKVYTPKAFRNTFDLLTEKGQEREEPKPSRVDAKRAEANEKTLALREAMLEDESERVDPTQTKKEDEALHVDNYVDPTRVAEKDEEEYVLYMDEKEKAEEHGE